MCGIVGYVGTSDPKEIIINGLRKLEYRGYDSAGVAIFDQGIFRRVRAEGKLKNLEEKLKGEKFTGKIGIGHTRWATHGAPSERNAHPHQVKGISLVHNGIIENYLEIKDYLIKKGSQITSDTDSELVAHLIAEQVEIEKDLFKAVNVVLEKIRGAFSILVVWDQQPNRIVAFKDGPPLVVGLGADQTFVVSDVQAALQYTNRFVYLEDREIVCVDQGHVDIYDGSGKKIIKPVIEINWNAEQVEKMGYSHFMLKEIYEEPHAVAAALEPHIDLKTKAVRLARVGFGGTSPNDLAKINFEADWQKSKEVFGAINRIIIVACGTSHYASIVGKYYFERLIKVPVEVDVASEFRYRHPVLDEKTLVMTISQSGETADTLAALRLAKSLKAQTLSLCNVKNSTIDREADGHLYMNSGPEIGVASTKAFVSTLTVLNLLAVAIAKAKKTLEPEVEAQHVSALLALPSQMEAALAFDKYFADAAVELIKYKGFLYIGRGVSFPIALEGALKMKELAYFHAEGYAAGEMKHGPLALIDENMAIVMVAPSDELYEKTLSNLEEARARGGKIISIGTGNNEKLRALSERYLSIPLAHWSTNPVLSVIPLHLMAFHVAKRLGHDVDQPRNLAKSVTVE